MKNPKSLSFDITQNNPGILVETAVPCLSLTKDEFTFCCLSKTLNSFEVLLPRRLVIYRSGI